jgi:hypothetical protein
MSLGWAIAIVVGAAAVAIAALMLVRRRAPEGGVFTDSDRAAGVFGVLATAFFLVLGFIIFLAFASYDESRSGSETEALAVVQQVETAQLLPASVASRLSGELVCYGRSVVYQEWPAMEAGESQDEINLFAVALFRTFGMADPANAGEEAAYSKWLDQTSTREEGRLDRLHGAEGIIPTPVWLVLFLAASAVFIFMLFFADPGERRVVQALQIGLVVALMASSLVVLRYLNEPYHSGIGGLRPVAMQRSLDLIDQALRSVDANAAPPCTADGTPTQS